MKAKWCIVFMALVALQTAMAHPPSKILLDFNTETHILKVVINHSVQDTVKHFINALTVTLNGNEVVNQKFWTQFDSQEQEAQFLIHDAKSGDQIEVTATCNVFGKKKESIQLP